MFNGGYNNAGYQNGNQNQVSVSTTLHTLYSDVSSLRIGAWNDQLSLRFNPIIPTVEGYSGRRYDYQNGKITAVRLDGVEALKRSIDEKIMPVIEQMESGVMPTEPVSVSVKYTGKNGTNILSIEIRKDGNGDNYGVFLVFYGSVSENLQANDGNTGIYKFGTHTMVVNYNPIDGSIAGETLVESEFRLFYHVLEKIIEITPFGYHGQKYSNAFKQMSSNGFQNGYQNGFQQNNAGNDFNGGGMSQNGYSAQTTSVDGSTTDWLNS